MIVRLFAFRALPHNLPADVELDSTAARHLAVLRRKVGELVVLFDGLGGEFHAVLTEVGTKRARARIERFDAVERESPLKVTLVQALVTGDKMDFIVQKAVELGFVAIQPVVTMRATLRLDAARAAKRVDHWSAIARSACEQCGRNRVPQVHAPVELRQWLGREIGGTILVLAPSATGGLGQAATGERSMALVVGPEGGFDDSELAMADHAGAQRISLGPRTLRTETAGLAAMAALNALAGDFR